MEGTGTYIKPDVIGQFTPRPVDVLIDLFGTCRLTGQAFGFERSVVETWRRRGYIPSGYGRTVEGRTGGKITANDVYIAAGQANDHLNS